MKWRTVGCLVTLALGILVALPVADAQQPVKVARIGFLAGGGRGGLGSLLDLFQHALREVGYVEGHNIAIEPRFAEGRDQRLPDLAAELVHRQVDVIVATSTPAAQAAKEATRTLPIVMTIGGDPLQTGLITSLARPEGNVTGTFQNPSELTGKLLEFLKEVRPGLSRLAVLWVPTNPALGAEWQELERAARGLGVQVQSLTVQGPDDLEGAFKAATRMRADALLTLRDPLTSMHRERIAAFALESRLPSIYSYRGFVDAGGLMSYGARLPDMFRRAAVYVDKILKGARPGDLPVEQSTSFELVINLKTAKALGITIPPTLLFQADEVIR